MDVETTGFFGEREPASLKGETVKKFVFFLVDLTSEVSLCLGTSFLIDN